MGKIEMRYHSYHCVENHVGYSMIYDRLFNPRNEDLMSDMSEGVNPKQRWFDGKAMEFMMKTNTGTQ